MFTKGLKYYRTLNGYSQKDISKPLEVTQQSVARWEKGEASPSPESLAKLSKMFNTTIDNIVKYGDSDEGVDGSDTYEKSPQIAILEQEYKKLPIFTALCDESDVNCNNLDYVIISNTNIDNIIALKWSTSRVAFDIQKRDVLIIEKTNEIRSGDTVVAIKKSNKSSNDMEILYKVFLERETAILDSGLGLPPVLCHKKELASYNIIGRVLEIRRTICRRRDY